MKERLVLPNLNTIRFIAATAVLVHHSEQIKATFGSPNIWGNKTIYYLGPLGIVLFFTLSGFLITYLLLQEQEKYQTISIKDFYVRRILRIWPLYYLIIFFAFFVLPYIPLFTMPGQGLVMVHAKLLLKLFLFVFFLPNMILSTFGSIPYCGQTWTIGTEEQFYIIWPVLMKYVRNKWVLIISVILIYPAVQFILYKSYLPHSLLFLIYYWNTFWIETMATGGLFALIAVSNKETLKKIVFSRYTQAAALLLLILMQVTGYTFRLDYYTYQFYALLFGVLIVNFSLNPNRLFNFENKVTYYLGKISYGIYMYHAIAIALAVKLVQYLNIRSGILTYILIFGFTIALASVSYEFFEKWFIRRKIKYSKIVTGDNVEVKSKIKD